MKPYFQPLTALFTTLLLTSCVTTPEPDTPAGPGYGTRSPEAYKIQQDSLAAMNDLYKRSADARWCGQAAKAVLVFPEVTKAGFMVGAQGGKGALYYRDTGFGGYYSTVSATYGLQAGVQQFGYALFMMDEDAIAKLNKSSGWEIGSGPNLTVFDMGTAKSISNITVHRGTYAFFFNQKGLMGGLGLVGTKISRIHP